MLFAKDDGWRIKGVQQIVPIDDRIKIFAYFRRDLHQEEKILSPLVVICRL